MEARGKADPQFRPIQKADVSIGKPAVHNVFADALAQSFANVLPKGDRGIGRGLSRFAPGS
jgi:hypothetical protein